MQFKIGGENQQLDLNLIEDIKLNCAFYLSMVGLELAPLSLAIINHVCDFFKILGTIALQ